MPLPAFFVGRWLLAEQPENSDAVVCFCQPSSVEIELNAVKLPLVFVGARKMPHLIHDTHGPMAHVHRDLSTMFHVMT